MALGREENARFKRKVERSHDHCECCTVSRNHAEGERDLGTVDRSEIDFRAPVSQGN